MKKEKLKIYLTIIAIISLLLVLGSKTYAQELEKGELSKRYQEWLKLPEEERKNTIAPLPFNVRQDKVKGVAKLRSIAKAATLPSKYDLRDYFDIEVKNQMDTGSCWAFSANSTLEITLAKQGETYNFSERHLEYDTASNFLDGENEFSLNRMVNAGGYFSTAYTYYSRGSGPILEEDMPFENNVNLISINELPKNLAIKKVDNIIYFPCIYKEKDDEGNIIYLDANYNEYTEAEVLEVRNQIKEHIMTYGAVRTDIFAPDMGELSSNKNEVNKNHAVTIIGWDDNYSKDNFENVPNNDGAYIVLNSWGTEFGENGIYYISYEDSLVETEIAGVIGVSDIEYDNLYQYDISEIWNSLEYKYSANVFESKQDEILTEIMIGATNSQTCNIYLNTTRLDMQDSTLIASNVKLNPGYTTIKLDNEIELNEGDNFAIIVEITSEEIKGIGIEDNNDVWFGNAKSNSNESFVSRDGENWEDIYDGSNMMNLSIKAYTKEKEKSIEVSDIKGEAYEGYGGKFSFSVKTSCEEKGNNVYVKVYKNQIDVTNNFIISGNTVRGNGAFLTLEYLNNIEQGQYNVLIYLENYNTESIEFTVLPGSERQRVKVSFLNYDGTQIYVREFDPRYYEVNKEDINFFYYFTFLDDSYHEQDVDGKYYTFVGWDKPLPDKITEDMTFTAKWKEDSEIDFEFGWAPLGVREKS